MKIIKIEGVPEQSTLKRIIQFNSLVFGNIVEEEHFFKKIQSKKNVVSFIAEDNHEIIGIKIGYEDKPKYFYSWVGGVSLKHRRKGIAGKLMEELVSWCQSNQYQFLETRTKVANSPMLILNLKSGFIPAGMIIDPKHGPQLILTKNLF